MTALQVQLQNILASWDAADITAGGGGGIHHTLQQQQEPLSRHFRIEPAQKNLNDTRILTEIGKEEDPKSSVPVSFLSSSPSAAEGSPSAASIPLVGSNCDTAEQQQQESYLYSSAVRNPRTAVTRVELARAALAVFTSNAGLYRPALQKMLGFLFEYIDFLVDERGDLLLQASAVNTHRMGAGGHFATVGTAVAAANSVSSNAEGAAESEANDAVAAAYQKVRMVEARMASLVEEASAQRDRFREQIATYQREVAKLEGLLMHQMELTHMMYDGDGNLLTGGAVTGTQKDPLYVRRLIMRAEKEKALEELETKVAEMTAERERLEDMVARLRKLNSRYARQAVELSARLSIIHDHNMAIATDLQLYRRDAMVEKRRSAKVARDLAAAHNMLIALLDARTREELLSAAEGIGGRGMRPGKKNMGVLMATSTKQIPGEQEDEKTRNDVEGIAEGAEGDVDIEEECKQREGSAAMTERSEAASSSKSMTGTGRTPRVSWRESPARAPSTLPEDKPLPIDNDSLADTHTSMSSSLASEDSEAFDQVDEALAVIKDPVLRRQLQSILSINDAANGGAAKSTLLSILSIKRASRMHLIHAVTKQKKPGDKSSSSPVTMGGIEFKQRQWSPPLGRGVHIPRHLRSHLSVPLLTLHPLVAECFVHEIMSQRLELIEYARREAMEALGALHMPLPAAQGARASVITAGGKSEPESSMPKRRQQQQMQKQPPLRIRPMALDEFIELFVNVVWLNREQRLIPLLPPHVSSQLKAERARERAKQRHSTVKRQLEEEDHENLSDSPIISNVVKWELHCLLHSVRPPEDILRLPEEGLKLTYSLDVASRRPDAGFLTYAFGLASRGELSEVVFDVFRNERAVFLAMCERVDIRMEEAREAHRAEGRRQLLQQRMSAGGKGSNSGEATTATGCGAKPVKPRGCIPTVQIARVLAAMYPSYPLLKLEQLVVAATEDGTDSLGSPVMVYYTVLIPERLLPGTASSSIEGGTFWRGGAFASAFFSGICDDILESFKLVEDSLLSFARNRGGFGAAGTTSNNTSPNKAAAAAGGGAAATAAVASGGVLEGGLAAVTVTAKQLSTLGFQAVPVPAMRWWSVPLRSVIYKWPRLHAVSTLADAALSGESPVSSHSTRKHSLAASPAAASRGADGGGGMQESFLSSSMVSGAAKTEGVTKGSVLLHNTTSLAETAAPMVARVPILEVMPYLRRNLILRRGPHVVVPEMESDDSSSQAPSSRISISQSSVHFAHLESSPLSTELDFSPHQQRRRQRQQEGLAAYFRWNPEHEEYLKELEQRWSRYAPANDLTLASEAATFMALVRVLDDQREAVWGSEEVCEGNPAMRAVEREVPLGDWEVIESTSGDSGGDVDLVQTRTVRSRGSEGSGRRPSPPAFPIGE